jgi:hypothetical protein
MAISLIFCIIGGIVYIVCSIAGRYAEVGELGRLAFVAGLLAFLLKG